MSDKSTLLKTFNTQFFAFLDDIIGILPDNKDIAAARKSFFMIKTANASLIIKVWYQYVYSPYKDTIDSGDIAFFYNKDYSGDLVHVPNSGEVMLIIDTIRDPIRTMSDANKGHTLKYLQILCKLSNLYSQA
jgi:hypothetical protein